MNGKNTNLKSSLSGESIDPVKAIKTIRYELKGNQFNHFDDSDDLSILLDKAVGRMELMLEGLNYLHEHTALGEYLEADKIMALDDAFYNLKELIEVRENEHDYIWGVAFHGKYESVPHSED